MAKLSISLLGPFIAELDGEPLSGFRSAKVRALLAYLAVESGRPWSRTTLADLFWPDLLENKAQSNLRNAISNLRDVIGDRRENPPFLFVSQDTLQYNQKSDTWLDVSAVMDFVATASEAGGRVCNQDDIDLMEHTLALYRGDFMEGFSIASAPFEEWALVKSEQIRQKMLQAVRYLVMGYEQSGELDKALHLARRWVELEPWEEAAHRSLMRILFGKGQRNAALVQYEACRQLLINDLGVEPEPATTQLYEQIRTGQIDPRISEKELFDTSHPGQMPSFLQGKHKLQSELTLFVDRQEEIKRLKSELDKAVSGKGGILFVTGDPGSGKTALLAEFARRAMIQYRDLVVVWGQCNAYTGAGDPYFPFLEVAQMLSGDVEARVVGGAITPEHATRLWNILPKVIWALLNDGPDLINRFVSGRDLLANAKMNNGVKPEQLARLHTQVEQLSQQAARPDFQQATLFSQFTKVLSILSQRNPLVLILDDLQWIDTDSVNLLFHLVRKLSGDKILLLGAYRPEDVALGRQGERHPIEGVIHELQTNLGDIHIDLMQNEGVDFVESILDSEPNKLSRDFRRMLHRHTAGHPLFTIELLRGMQLRGDIRRNEQGKWVAGARLNWDELPVRVEAVIAERIGHLPKDYQDLLRIASVEGEQFTAEILARIQGKEELDVIHILSQKISKLHRLVIAQSRKQIRGQNLSQYRFRHFLYQKYLYNQLDEVEKAYLHEKVGSALEELFLHQDLLKYPETAHQLARHFEIAGMVEKAVHYYTESGKYAGQLCANREAITHFKRALHLVGTLPDSDKRDRQALNLHLSLGPPLTATRGWGAPELENNYRQAEELCHKVADDAQLVPALWLLAVYRIGRSEHEIADKLVERLFNLTQKIGDPRLLCLADLQVSPLYQGKLTQARQILTRASLPRDVSLQRSLAYQYGMAPSVVALAYLSNCLWLLGFPEQAVQCSQEACDFAAVLNIPFTTCYALSRACWLCAFAGEIDSTRIQGEKLLQITQQHEFRKFELAAVFFLNWVNTQTGVSAADEIDKMQQAMEEYQSLDTLLNRTTFLILFAEACVNAGQIERGLAALDEAIALGERTGERWFDAEAYRVKGELLVRQAENSVQQEAYLNEAENCFQVARQIAGQQEARLLELRAVISLCRLWQSQGKGNDGRHILSEIVSQFTEGLYTIDLRKGKALLVELNG